MPDWLVTTPTRYTAPRAAGPAPRGRRPRAAPAAGSPLYGTSTTACRRGRTARRPERRRHGVACRWREPAAQRVPDRGRRDQRHWSPACVATSAGLRGPGAIRRAANSAVPTAQPAQGGGRACVGVGRQRERWRAAPQVVSRRDVPAPAPSRSAGRSPPVTEPCSRAISTSSALPACARTLTQRPTGRTGWVTRRVPSRRRSAGPHAPAGRGRRPRGRRGGSARRTRPPAAARCAGRPCRR